MKTTNYEISKQLVEAGFKAGTDTVIHDPNHAITGARYASFCLETILAALPNFIENGNGTGNCLVVDVAFGEIHYEGDSDNDAMFITTTEENESLADTAARLWLKLKKEGLV